MPRRKSFRSVMRAAGFKPPPTLKTQAKRALGIKTPRRYSAKTRLRRALGIPSTPRTFGGWLRRLFGRKRR
jgi:hypothetical protein